MGSLIASTPLISSATSRDADPEQIDLSLFERNTKNIWALVATEPVELKLQMGGQSQTVRGQTSFNLETSPELLKTGYLRVVDLNLSLFRVNQTHLSSHRSTNKAEGILGFSILNKLESKALLKYDPQTLSMKGQIGVNMNFPQIDEIAPPKGREDDFFVSARVPAHIDLELKLDQPLEKLLLQDPQKLRYSARFNVLFRGSSLGAAKLHPLQAEFMLPQKQAELAPLLKFEVARRLCLQPVRIKASTTDMAATGMGLPFGLPGAKTQWSKADINFEVRAWKTVVNSALKIVDNAAEETLIRNSVQDDDCIEVFFVENFNPPGTHGGGATWASGTASAQIISSDGNATGGVDFTHLAHELGHVLALGHPSGSPGLVSGNTGTLMCPSGWHNDNPAKNSQGNKDHSGNPLLRLSIKLRSAGPDCNSNGDCGPCT
jgi:hypothetical protein